MAAAAPWASAAPSDQLFVLVTGANSGIGLGIGQRLIDEFLARRPGPDAHLVLVTTTRSAGKSRETTGALRRHLAVKSSSLHPERVHLASVELDLCCLPSVHAAAARLRGAAVKGGGGIAVYSGAGTTAVTVPSLPRLDTVVCNAGIGGWTGVHYWRFTLDILTAGYLQATTFPGCKMATAGLLVDPLTGQAVVKPTLADGDDTDTALGQVFCANVFGHYVLVHALLPLLRRPAASALPAARIVWESSIEAVCWRYLAVADGDHGDGDDDDLQGVRTTEAYESSKRLTDVLALTADLPGVGPFSGPFFADDDDDDNDDKAKATTPPRTYLSHPGVVCSTFFPLPWLLFYAYVAAMYVARWCGSPWHPVTPYRGASAAVWLALQPQAALDALDAQHSKWGAGTTATARDGAAAVDFVKRSEVEGWGWGRGRDRATADASAALFVASAADADNPGAAAAVASYLDNGVGRRRGCVEDTVSAERRQAFEALGRRCWQEMERLRRVWEARVQAMEEKS